MNHAVILAENPLKVHNDELASSVVDADKKCVFQGGRSLAIAIYDLCQ